MYKEKREEHIERICCCKEKLLEWIGAEMSCGPEGACLDALGKLTDMVKDLAEAEAECAEACEKEAKEAYYWSIVEAMHSGERAGYDKYRYMSTGQYAPKGHGTRSGYSTKGNPRGLGEPDHLPPHIGRMGYPLPDDMIPPVYNDPYNPIYGQEDVGGPWYYHEGEDRHMTQEEKVRSTMDNMKEMWHNADPALKKEMKSDMSNLINDIPV